MATRADLEAAMNRMLFWFVGMLMGVIGILGGALIALIIALFRLAAA
ncbi:MAG: hypothetical protein OD918_03330 [Gammaproteobacteria bacterium]